MMTREQAFQILGLPITASPEEVQDHFRELARTHHPDVGGTDDSMNELLEARRTALANTSVTALVPIEALRDLLQAASFTALSREVKANETTRVLREIHRRHTLFSAEQGEQHGF